MGEENYRILKHGEIVQEGDEYDFCANPWKDMPKWRKVLPSEIGLSVPDPQYPAHRIFRRPIEKTEAGGVGMEIIKRNPPKENIRPSFETCDYYAECKCGVEFKFKWNEKSNNPLGSRPVVCAKCPECGAICYGTSQAEKDFLEFMGVAFKWLILPMMVNYFLWLFIGN